MMVAIILAEKKREESIRLHRWEFCCATTLRAKKKGNTKKIP